MIRTIAIDPGIKLGCAYVIAEDGLISRCGFTHDPLRDQGINTAIVERPAYQGAKSDGATAQVLMDLAWFGAKVAYGSAPVVHEYTPRDWKGSKHKPVHHAAIWEMLNRDERSLFGGDYTKRIIDATVEKGARDRWKRPGGDYYPKSFVTHNLLDAAGLLLFATGRRL